jgi:hypothetical protein
MSTKYLQSTQLTLTMPPVNLPPPPSDFVPREIIEYLESMGWSMVISGPQVSFHKKHHTDPEGYHSWNEAVTYCLIKPFLKGA